VPPDPGTYQLDVHGGGARTSVLLWVSGPGQAAWPQLPNQRLDLSANQESYLPGESAQIFIPNPLGGETRALLTVERGTILRHQVLNLAGSGTTVELPLSGEDAPNVYVSVTLIGRGEAGQPDFRQGYLNLTVEPVQQTLNVQVTSQPERAGPGEEATFEIQVSDQDGNPVQGEFSRSSTGPCWPWPNPTRRISCPPFTASSRWACAPAWTWPLTAGGRYFYRRGWAVGAAAIWERNPWCAKISRIPPSGTPKSAPMPRGALWSA
jgi:hypothetical protein